MDIFQPEKSINRLAINATWTRAQVAFQSPFALDKNLRYSYLQMGTIKPIKISSRDNTSLLIRTAEPKDTVLFDIYFPKLHSESQFLIDESGEYKPSPKIKDWIQTRKVSKNSLYIVATSGNNLVGECSVWDFGHRKRLRHRAGIGLSIDQEWRGVGLGFNLMTICIDWAKNVNNNIEKLELNVFEGNYPAINLYKKLGFTLEGRVSKAYKVGDDTYVDQLNMSLYI